MKEKIKRKLKLWDRERFRVCLVELWLWKKAVVGCELWKSCCGCEL